jgi:hypothetical protein
MLKMKWMTDHDGRLVATWIQSGEPGFTGCREATIMLKMKWTIDPEGRLGATPAQSAKGHPGSKASRWVSLCLLTIILVCVLPSLFASTGGSISGLVKDPSGAVIPGATVTAINSATGVKQTIKTEGQGLYSFPVLAVGTYEIQVSENGFQPYRVKGLRVDINSALVADVTLQLGEQRRFRAPPQDTWCPEIPCRTGLRFPTPLPRRHSIISRRVSAWLTLPAGQAAFWGR